MVRNSYYLAAFVAALTTLTAVLAQSQTLPPIGAIVTSIPVCYIQLQNGQLRDLRRLCGKTPDALPGSTPTNPQQPGLQSDPDSDEDDSPAAAPNLRRRRSQPTSGTSPTPQPTPTQPSSQPTNLPGTGIPGTPDRPTRSPTPQPTATQPSSQPTNLPGTGIPGSGIPGTPNRPTEYVSPSASPVNTSPVNTVPPPPTAPNDPG